MNIISFIWSNTDHINVMSLYNLPVALLPVMLQNELFFVSLPKAGRQEYFGSYQFTLFGNQLLMTREHE